MTIIGRRGYFTLTSSSLHAVLAASIDMQTKDYLISTLAPLAVLIIPLVGNLTVEGWNWTWSDFVVAWVLLAFAAGLLRLLMTRTWSNFAYKTGAALAVGAGFLLFWINLAVQIIGDENPGNLLYFLTIAGGLVGVARSRLAPVNLARVAFGMAAVLLVIPAVSFVFWPADFNPGYPRVQILSACFAAVFAGSGLLFRRAAGEAALAR